MQFKAIKLPPFAFKEGFLKALFETKGNQGGLQSVLFIAFEYHTCHAVFEAAVADTLFCGGGVDGELDSQLVRLVDFV